MATTYKVSDGEDFTFTAGGAIAEGSVQNSGTGLIGIAKQAYVSGDTVVCMCREGAVYEGVLKDNTVAFVKGDRLYYDSTNKWLDKTAGSQYAVAIADDASADTDTHARVRWLRAGASE